MRLILPVGDASTTERDVTFPTTSMSPSANTVTLKAPALCAEMMEAEPDERSSTFPLELVDTRPAPSLSWWAVRSSADRPPDPKEPVMTRSLPALFTETELGPLTAKEEMELAGLFSCLAPVPFSCKVWGPVLITPLKVRSAEEKMAESAPRSMSPEMIAGVAE